MRALPAMAFIGCLWAAPVLAQLAQPGAGPVETSSLSTPYSPGQTGAAMQTFSSPPPAPGGMPADAWRFVERNGLWWYYQPNKQWVYWVGGRWVEPGPDSPVAAQSGVSGGTMAPTLPPPTTVAPTQTIVSTPTYAAPAYAPPPPVYAPPPYYYPPYYGYPYYGGYPAVGVGFGFGPYYRHGYYYGRPTVGIGIY